MLAFIAYMNIQWQHQCQCEQLQNSMHICAPQHFLQLRVRSISSMLTVLEFIGSLDHGQLQMSQSADMTPFALPSALPMGLPSTSSSAAAFPITSRLHQVGYCKPYHTHVCCFNLQWCCGHPKHAYQVSIYLLGVLPCNPYQ